MIDIEKKMSSYLLTKWEMKGSALVEEYRIYTKQQKVTKEVVVLEALGWGLRSNASIGVSCPLKYSTSTLL